MTFLGWSFMRGLIVASVEIDSRVSFKVDLFEGGRLNPNNKI